MKTILRFLFVLLLTSCAPAMGFADSPVTSTPIYNAYSDQQIVQKAQTAGTVTKEIANYLKDPNNPRDFKAAVINALYNQQTWDVRDHASTYTKLVYNKSLAELKLDQLSTDELFNLGYMVLLDQYTTPEKSFVYLEKAQAQEPKSLTLSVILALAKAQQALLSPGPGINPWEISAKVFDDKTLIEDLRPEALEIIKGYMSLYKPAQTSNPQPDEAQSKALLFDFDKQPGIKVYVNSNSVYFDVPPVIDRSTNRTLVPFRKIFEALGATVWYDEATNSVWGRKGNVTVCLPINQARATINGQTVLLDAPSKIVDRRTMVPLRFVSQALGYKVTAYGESENLNIFITQ